MAEQFEQEKARIKELVGILREASLAYYQESREVMSNYEYDKLYDELLELENPSQCPHGRPTIVKMSRYEIEKKFKRIV